LEIASQFPKFGFWIWDLLFDIIPTYGGLRMEDIEYLVQDILIALITILALVLLIIAAMAYSRTRNKKILLITAGFGAFFIKGLILSVGLYTEMLSSKNLPSSFVVPFDILLMLDFLILLLLYFSVFKK
jgi:hypothetical protein